MKLFKNTGKKKQSHQDGFTIVELMIATAVFSVILIVVTQTLVYITNSYYEGVMQQNTQNVTRNIVNTIGEDIQFNDAIPYTAKIANDNTTLGYCIGTILYSYLKGQEVENSPNFSQDQAYHGLVELNSQVCSSQKQAQTLSGYYGNNLTPGSTELLGQNMRLADFSINSIGNNSTGNLLYQIYAKVVYGDTDLLTNPTLPNAACIGGDSTQFCYTTDLSTVVQVRVN